MMKIAPLFKVLILISTTFAFSKGLLGQSLFFDNLYESFWISSSTLNPEIISEKREFSLTKLTSPTQQSTENQFVWIFKDSLEIYFADPSMSSLQLRHTFAYHREGRLLILSRDDLEYPFNVGIVSTGNFVLLTSESIKEKKKRLRNQ